MARTRYQNPQEGPPLRDLPFAAIRAVWREGYSVAALRADLMAGLVVGIVALPLAMALAIGVGVPPQQGLYTAIIAGAVVAVLGGSRTQVSGPTAAFIVILAPVYTRFGLAGLLIAGVLAGLLLVGMGLLRFGKFIEFIPHPVTTGFTAGIATVIAFLQVKDLLGLQLVHVPEHFVERLQAMFAARATASGWELLVGAFTLALLLLLPRMTRRVPAPLIALPAAAVVAFVLSRFVDGVHLSTIASRFHSEVGGRLVDGIPQLPPLPLLPWLAPGPHGQALTVDLHTLRLLLPSAFAIAMLGAIESLLSAVVADGMAGTRHDPDAELLALGVGNIVTPFFGGIPATGAIARTATNIRSGARSPIAAVVHAVTILAAVLALAPALGYLPMSALAALLLLVAWNMSEAKHFAHTVKVAPKSDVAVLLTCFALTVFMDMVVGVSVGMVLAAMLFMRRMAEVTETRLLPEDHPSLPGHIPPGVVVYSVSGPLFFGAAQKAMASLNHIADRAHAVVLMLDQVPALDATGLVALESALDQLSAHHAMAVLSGVRPQPLGVLKRAGVLRRSGVVLCDDAVEALRVASEAARVHSGRVGGLSADLTAENVMSRDVASVQPDMPLRDVAELMLGKGHRVVPVVDGGRLVGIITNGDLVERGGLNVRLELLRTMAPADIHTLLDRLSHGGQVAEDVMTKEPVSVPEFTPLPAIAEIMSRRRLKRLPVLGERGEMSGIVSRADLLRAAAGLSRRDEEAPRALGLQADNPLASVMRTDVPAVLGDTPLPEVFQAVISTRLNKVFVVDEQRHVIGLVTDAELLDRLTPSLRSGVLQSLMSRLPFARSTSAGESLEQHGRARKAKDLMTGNVPAAPGGTSVGEAIAIMMKAHRKVIAVIDGEGRLAGIVDRADLLRGLAPDARSSNAPPDAVREAS